MSNLIFVYSVPRDTATKISDWVNDTSGVKLKKTKIGRCDDKLMALYSPKIGGLANYISYTPHVDQLTGQPYVNEKGEPIMLQEYLEKKWNKPAGYFNNLPVPRNFKSNPDDLTYFQRTSWKMKDGCTVFDLSKMDDELGYYVLLASSKVANSEREWREHRWPKAQWYIALANESEEIKYQRTELRSKAFAALHDKDMTEVYKRKFVSLLDLASSSTRLTAQQIHNLLFNFIETSTSGAGSNIDRFNAIFRLLSTADGRTRIEAMWLLKQALDARIIVEKQGTYTFLRKTLAPIVIGERYDEAIDFILNSKKQTEVDEIKKEIELKTANV